MGFLRLEVMRGPDDKRPRQIIEYGTDPLSDAKPLTELQQHIEDREDWTPKSGPDGA
jgi:hypothetical protein